VIVPAQKDDVLLADVAAHRDGPSLWWLGQSGFLLMYQQAGLAIDPYLSDSLSRKYAQTDKPHTRMSERVVDPARLTGIVAATSSHNHTDHLDAETLNPLRAANPALQLVIPEPNRAFVAERLGCSMGWPIGLTEGESADIGPFSLTAIASAHEHLDPTFLGYVIEFGGFRVYHPGDCVLYEGLVEKLKPFEIDIALLPVNGSLPERRVAGNFWGREAAWLARAIGAQLAVPMHYHLFEFNTVEPDEFARECERLGQPYRVMQLGERLDVPRH
jgi:L-ascorbate metabolism protein UlaG (beta-lactamase superfamily)